MKKLIINLKEKSYPIYIKKNILDNIGEYIKNIYNGKKITIITDSNVNRLYGDIVTNDLTQEEFNVNKIVIRPGEKSKSINTLLDIYEKLLDFKITRGDLLIALGGGVVGDLAGFAAATFLRGIPYVQIPTSLLAQIDSCIGGKVAIDLPRGKNLVGSFYHPKSVFIDPNTLKTLEKKFFIDGMAEVIKYGCIRDEKLYDYLLNCKTEEQLFKNMECIIYSCCSIKKEIVEKDEKDLGDRMILNFGHTIGHAIEKYFNFEKYTHGEAVALGMYAITKKSEELGLTKKGTVKRIQEILCKYNLEYNIELNNKEKIIDIIAFDKKNNGEFINIIILREIGDAFIHKIKRVNIHDFI